jgi:hypothetical protein
VGEEAQFLAGLAGLVQREVALRTGVECLGGSRPLGERPAGRSISRGSVEGEVRAGTPLSWASQ